MSTYLISYDLHRPGRDYQTLLDHLRSYAYAKPLESLWLIRSSLGAGEIRDAILNHLDSNDSLLVIGVTNQAAWFNLPDAVSNWLKTNL